MNLQVEDSVKKKRGPKERLKKLISITDRQSAYLDDYQKIYGTKPTEIISRLIDKWIDEQIDRRMLS